MKKVAGIDDEVAKWSPVGSGTSLLGLVQHLAGAETLWVVTRFAGERGATPPPTETLEQAVDAYRAAWSRVGAIVATEDLEAQCRGLGPTSLRRTCAGCSPICWRRPMPRGHADIIRELIDGETGRERTSTTVELDRTLDQRRRRAADPDRAVAL